MVLDVEDGMSLIEREIKGIIGRFFVVNIKLIEL
jgi:hypothetical protein